VYQHDHFRFYAQVLPSDDYEVLPLLRLLGCSHPPNRKQLCAIPRKVQKTFRILGGCVYVLLFNRCNLAETVHGKWYRTGGKRLSVGAAAAFDIVDSTQAQVQLHACMYYTVGPKLHACMQFY
jgi:hypothetical protein